MHKCLKFIYFGMALCMFRTGFPSIIRSSRLYIQQQHLANRYYCLLASKTVQQYEFDCCCMYSLELLMMDEKNARNIKSVFCLSI